MQLENFDVSSEGPSSGVISELKIYNANLRRGRRIKQVLF
jgi:hypothetical protein